MTDKTIDLDSYVEMIKTLGAGVKGTALIAVEEILTEATHILTEAHARFCDDNLTTLANASLTGLAFTYKALEKVQSL